MILLFAAGFGIQHLWDGDWGPPVGLLAGLLVAPMIPIPTRRKDGTEPGT